MKPKVVLSVSAIYLAIIGFGMLLIPSELGVEAVPADAPLPLIAFLRIFGGPLIGIAVMNWLARTAEPSFARTAILIGNAVGFTLVTLSDVMSVAVREARPVAALFLILHLLFAIAFVLALVESQRATERRAYAPGT